MSKSGNYNLGEIEKRDALIQDLFDALKEIVEAWDADVYNLHGNHKLMNKALDALDNVTD